MNTIVEHLMSLWNQAFGIWISGGWAMIAIAVAALLAFALGVSVYLSLLGKGFTSVREKTWRHWINHPEQRKGRIGELLDFVTGGNSLKHTATFFDEMRKKESAPIERELRAMKICVSVAPLLGLLGTVTGMLATFNALASGAGGDKTMALVAEGISEALVTTETGLVIALPGLFLHYQVGRMHERYKAFLAHLETVCTQKVYRKLHASEPGREPARVIPLPTPAPSDPALVDLRDGRAPDRAWEATEGEGALCPAFAK